MYFQVKSQDPVEDTYFFWRSRGTESASANQEGVGLRFALLHIRVIAQDYMVEAAKEFLVLARLQLKGCTLGTRRHCDGDVVFLQMEDQFLYTFTVGSTQY